MRGPHCSIIASKNDSDNVDDTSSEVGDEYESDRWAPLKAEAAQACLSEFEELTQNFPAEGFDENEDKDKAYFQNFVKICRIFINLFRIFTVYLFSILIGSLLLDSIIRSVIHH
jgi:hypothetical protein